MSPAVVFEADTPPTAGAAPAAQMWNVGVAVDWTPPAATGGNISLDYAMTSALPAGLSFNSATRAITGTPTMQSASMTYTMTATDYDGDTADLMFEASVGPDPTVVEVSVSADTPSVREGDISVNFTVTLNGAATATSLDIPFAVTGTATRGSFTFPSSPVTLPAGAQDTARTATIRVPVSEADADLRDMAAVEGTETVIVTLGTLPTVSGLTFRADPNSAMVSITDTPLNIALGGMDREVEEHNTDLVRIPIVVTGQRARFQTAARFSVAGTATPGTDYEVVVNDGRTASCDTSSCIGTIRLFGGQGSGEIQIRIRDDGVRETAPETIIVTLIGHSGGGSEPTPLTFDATPTRTIGVSDPAPPAVMVTPTTLAITENSAAGNYEVVLSAVPTEDVTVTTGITPAGHDLTLVPAVGNELTFTATDWNTAQTVIVSAGTDADAIDDTATISHTVTAIGNYAAITDAADVTVTVTDTNATDTTPTFGGTTQDDVTYIADAAITPLTLPMGVAGNGALIYELTPEVGTVAPGLTFGGAGFDRVLRGTPTTAAGAVALTYTVADSDANTNAADTTALTFMVTVVAASRIDVAALDEVNEMILPEVARALAGQHAGAVTTRVRQAGQSGGGGGAGSFNFGGQSKLSSMAARHAQTLADDGVDMKRLLGDSDFVLPLGGGGLGGTLLAMWGAGDYYNIGGESKDGGTQWDGDLFGAHLGLDARLRPNLLAGLMMSYNKADIDYESATQEGEYELDMNSVNPYLGWSAFDGRLDIWATVGYGSGDLEITPHGDDALVHDVTTQTFGFGGGGLIRKNGEREWRLNAEAFHTRTEIDGADRNAAATQLTELKVDATRLRLMLETRHPRTLSSGASLTPSAEIGMRQDSGDGRTGAGVEVGGGVQYKDASRNLTLEANARALLAHSGDYDDWGISGKVQLQPGADGQGLSLSLTPGYGNTAAGSGIKNIWDNGVLDDAAASTSTNRNNPDLSARLDTRIGYGLPATAFGDHLSALIHTGPGAGLLTPYTELSLGEKQQSYRLGLEWSLGELFGLKLVGERSEGDDDDNAVLLQGEMRF